MLFDSDDAWLFAGFEDRASYDANAVDPAQDADYQEYRALMESDPPVVLPARPRLLGDWLLHLCPTPRSGRS